MVLPLPFNCWNDFNELEIVEVATPKAKAAPLPADISPTTPNFTPSQGYLGPAPSGIHATWPRILPGGRGEGVRVVDIERAWQLDHEDFPAVVSSSVHGIEDYKFHGTAVIGQIAAVENSYGMTGIAPAAEIAVYSDTTVTGSFELADAIARATVASRPGDVILIEEQVYCGTDFGPVEYDDSLLACIDAAVANGRVVVVPAGNGGLNLDDTARFGDRFQRNVVNSGAIYVGAADAGTLRAAAFSNFGSRIDFQGWGDSVATLGSGELFHPNRDDRQAYTGSFSGTSSAAPMVAGAAAIIQGVRKARALPDLTSQQMRDALKVGATPQAAGARHVGPQPDLKDAVSAIPVPAPAIRATGAQSGVVTISWDPVPGVSGYELFRKDSQSGQWTMVTSGPSTHFVNSSLPPNTSFVYRARAFDAAGKRSADSNYELTMTVDFSDPQLSGGAIVRATHVVELRSAVNALCRYAGASICPAPPFTGPSIDVTQVKTQPITFADIDALREQVTSLRAAIGALPPEFGEIAAASWPVRAVHVQDLRRSIQ